MYYALLNDPAVARFVQQLLSIGEGLFRPDVEGFITLPQKLCTVVDSQAQLIERVFPNIPENYLNHQWISQRAILASTNAHVLNINYEIMNSLPGEIRTYLSTNTVIDPDQVIPNGVS